PGGGLPHRLGDDLRKCGRERGDRANRAALDPAPDQRLRPDEDVEPLDQVRREALERRVRDLQPGEIRHLLAQTIDHLDRHGVPARARELVYVERSRRARPRCGGEMREQRALVQREVRRRDHGDAVGADRGCVLREGDRVRRRLGAAVDRDLEASRARVAEELCRAAPFGRGQQDPLARRTKREDAVEAAAREEVDERRKRLLVERGATVAERRRGSRQCPADHRRGVYAARTAITRARQAPRGASTLTTSPSRAPISARPSGESGETEPVPPRLETSSSIRPPSSSSISTREPTETRPASASSTTSEFRSRSWRILIRRSSRPCSFFAAWYSKFSERSPNSRAALIACTIAVRFGPSSSASSPSSAARWAAVSCSRFSIRLPIVACRRIPKPNRDGRIRTGGFVLPKHAL